MGLGLGLGLGSPVAQRRQLLLCHAVVAEERVPARSACGRGQYTEGV